MPRVDITHSGLSTPHQSLIKKMSTYWPSYGIIVSAERPSSQRTLACATLVLKPNQRSHPCEVKEWTRFQALTICQNSGCLIHSQP